MQFIPSLLTDFIEVIGRAVIDPAAAAAEAGGEGDQAVDLEVDLTPTLDRGALLYCERSLELLVDLLSQVWMHNSVGRQGKDT